MFAKRLAAAALFVLLAFVATTPFAAAEAKGVTGAGTVAETKAGDGHEKDPTAFIDLPKRWDLSLYTIAVFVLLFLILYFFAWPNISAGLQKREEMLSAVKDAAERAKREAEEVSAKLAAEFATANDKVRAMLEEARRDADALRAKERELGQKEAATERDRAKREIDAAKDAALQEIYQKAVDLATLLSTKAVKKNLSADDHRSLVDEALAELKAQPSRN
jgi:F-type H+-transporting ATPase subunit b